MRYRQSGYALPVTLIISAALVVFLIAALEGTLAMQQSLRAESFNRLARISAEAGNAYASACASKGITGWTDAAPLRPNTDCNGVVTGGSPYVHDSDGVTSTFTVPAIQTRADGSQTYTAQGVVTFGTSSNTYTQTVKLALNTSELEVVQSTSGQERTCSLISNDIYCWGANDVGQLGIGSSRPSEDPGDGSDWGYYLTPQKVLKEPGVLAGKIITQIKAGDSHTCAIADGEVYCWGYNNLGQLGQGTTGGFISKPVKVGGALAGKTATELGTLNRGTCAIADGKIYCWGGNNGVGTLGLGHYVNVVPNPTQVVGSINNYTAQKLTSGSRSFNVCAIANNQAWCWGSNDGGQLGLGHTNKTHTPTPVTQAAGVLAGKTVTAISMEGYSNLVLGSYTETHVCVIAGGKAYCWGGNSFGELGIGNTTNQLVPVPVSTTGVLSGKTVTDISTAGKASCFLADGNVYCTGSNSTGLLGVNSTSPSQTSVPVAVAKLPGGLQGKTVTALGGGSGRACALADGLSYCWGNNSAGQIGDGTTILRRAPTEAIFLRPKSRAIAF